MPSKGRTLATAGGLENVEFQGDFIKIPAGSTANRPTTTEAGQLRFNTDDDVLEQYTVGGWKAIDSPPIVSSVTPTSFDGAAGTQFTITGSNFKSGATVTFTTFTGSNLTASTTTVNSSTQVVATTPRDILVSEEPITIKVTNSNGLSGTLSDAIDAGSTPSFITAAGNVGTVYEDVPTPAITIEASDPDGQTVTYSISSGALPTGLTLDGPSGEINGTPNVNDAYAAGGVTHNFDITAQDSVGNQNVRSFNIIRKWYDGSTEALSVQSPQALRDIGITTNGQYYIRGVGMNTGRQYQVDFNRRDGKDWVLLFQAPNRGTAVVNHINDAENLLCKGWMVTSGSGSEYYSYFNYYSPAAPRRHDTTGTDPITATSFAGNNTASGGNMGGYRWYMGNAGGMGWYNTGQNVCSWSSGSGAVGAGYDGSSCGSWPNGLILGFGQGGTPNYSEQGGTWYFWGWMNDQAT